MTPQKQRHLIISLALSAVTIFFAYLYFSPTPQKKMTPIPVPEKVKGNLANYDSLLTLLLKDTTSSFRKTFDSIYKQPSKKEIKNLSPNTIKKTSDTTKIKLQNKAIKKSPVDTVKPKPKLK